VSHVTARIIVLNGGSSSGKTTIACELQAILTPPWMRVGVDELIDALPPSLIDSASGIDFGPQGEVTVGEDFREIEAAWIAGIAAMARAGARIIVEDVFLGGRRSQERIRELLEDVEVLWAGVRCPAAIAAERERGRGDRALGMAASQAEAVHDGVGYDIEVDSSLASSRDCALAIAARVD
jgi:chloramphenicol 3-O phosphotransferase